MSTFRKGAYGFNKEDECHFEIAAEEQGTGYDLNEVSEEYEYYMNVSVKSTNSFIYLNNGSSIFTASDEIRVGHDTGFNFMYKAKNNKVYALTIGYGDLPTTTFYVLLWKKPNLELFESYFSQNWTEIFMSEKA